MKQAITILVLIVAAALLFLAAKFMLLTGDVDAQHQKNAKLSATAVSSWFVWLDWDANPASDHVTNYILYMGEKSKNYPARIVLGNQTSIQVIKNHPVTYCAVSAYNAVGESPKSNEISFAQ